MLASGRGCGRSPCRMVAVPSAEKRCAELVEEDVDDRRGVERQHLAEQQAADHGDAERPAQLRADAACPAPAGRPPSSAAIVVIMIGRKRSRQAS